MKQKISWHPSPILTVKSLKLINILLKMDNGGGLEFSTSGTPNLILLTVCRQKNLFRQFYFFLKIKKLKVLTFSFLIKPMVS
jgi:hypothetical protein